MKQNSNILSIIAYYLSEYSEQAVKELGFDNTTQAFKQISTKFNRKESYLRLRRDEFDALPNSSSSRKGWNKRAPNNEVIRIAEHLQKLSFDELTCLVRSFLNNNKEIRNESNLQNEFDILKSSEIEIENIINLKDEKSTIILKQGNVTTRIYDKNIIMGLKLLYGGKCQICGSIPSDLADISEAHHIRYFSHTQNNDADNIIILCPNHHRIIHKLNPKFDYSTLSFVFPDGQKQKVILNFHLGN